MFWLRVKFATEQKEVLCARKLLRLRAVENILTTREHNISRFRKSSSGRPEASGGRDVFLSENYKYIFYLV